MHNQVNRLPCHPFTLCYFLLRPTGQPLGANALVAADFVSFSNVANSDQIVGKPPGACQRAFLPPHKTHDFFRNPLVRARGLPMVSVYSEKDKKRRSAPQRAQGGKRHAGQKGKGIESHRPSCMCELCEKAQSIDCARYLLFRVCCLPADVKLFCKPVRQF